MPTIDSLHELLKHELKDLYSAETQIIDALPKMIEAAANTELKNALKQHLAITKTQKKRLDEMQQILGEEKVAPEKKGFFANIFTSKEGEEHCKAMEGLVKEGNALLKEDMIPEVMDAAIIAAAQKIEHYEISSYGTAHAYALQLQLNKVANLLAATLKEEYEADDSLTKLALSKVNADAEFQLKKTGKPENQPAAKAVKKSVKSLPKKASPKKIKAAKKSSSKNVKQKK